MHRVPYGRVVRRVGTLQQREQVRDPTCRRFKMAIECRLTNVSPQIGKVGLIQRRIAAPIASGTGVNRAAVATAPSSSVRVKGLRKQTSTPVWPDPPRSNATRSAVTSTTGVRPR